MKKIYTLALVLFAINYLTAQGTWTQETNFGGTARALAVGFSIGNYGYIGTGNAGGNTKDFWQYNPADNTWTQKADYGGAAREKPLGLCWWLWIYMYRA